MQKKISLSQYILREILRTPKALSHIKHLFVLNYNLRSTFLGEIWIQFDFISFDEIKINFLLESLTFPLWSFSSVDFSGAPSYSKKWKTAAVKSQIMAFHDLSIMNYHHLCGSLIHQELKDCGCQVANHGFSRLITIFVVATNSQRSCLLTCIAVVGIH